MIMKEHPAEIGAKNIIIKFYIAYLPFLKGGGGGAARLT